MLHVLLINVFWSGLDMDNDNTLTHAYQHQSKEYVYKYHAKKSCTSSQPCNPRALPLAYNIRSCWRNTNFTYSKSFGNQDSVYLNTVDSLSTSLSQRVIPVFAIVCGLHMLEHSKFLLYGVTHDSTEINRATLNITVLGFGNLNNYCTMTKRTMTFW